MKKLLIAAAAVAAMSSGAMAQTGASQDINLSASVASYCTIGGATGASITNLGASFGTNIGPAGVLANQQTVAIGTVVCNAPSNATLSSAKGALLGPQSSGGLQNYINYNATTVGLQTQASVAATVSTGAVTPTGSGTVAQANAFNNSVSVNITPVAATTLLAGSYSDVLTFAILPQ
jgi:hypothetical protein